MASRRNSQIFCWLTQKEQSDQVLPSAFDNQEDVDDLTEEEVKGIVREEAEDEKVISFNRAKENSVVYEALPEGYDAKQLQMTHPNSNVQTMVDFLANRCAASMGLSKLFATGNPEDTNWRANQLFSFPTILEFQHDLEQLNDWIFYCFVKWSVRIGTVKSYLAEDFMDYVDWEWKGLDDIDQVAHQNGIRLGLENNVLTYRDILGNNWKDKLD